MKSSFRNLLIAGTFYLYNHFIGKFPIYWVRHAYIRRILRIRLGKDAAIHMGCFFTGKDTIIGDRTVINRGCHLDGRGSLRIGSDVSISPYTYLVTLTHDVDDSMFGAEADPVVIEDRVWIGVRALLLPGVHIGIGGVVGAGSVVTRNCPSYTIVAGNPAKQIGMRSQDLSYHLDYHPLFDTDILLRN